MLKSSNTDNLLKVLGKIYSNRRVKSAVQTISGLVCREIGIVANTHRSRLPMPNILTMPSMAHIPYSLVEESCTLYTVVVTGERDNEAVDV